MFKMMLLSFLIMINIYAKTMMEKYSVEYGIIGEIAKVSASMKTNKNSYVIDANLTVIGFIANKATDNLKERHISKGHISKGKYITDMYQMIKSYGKYNATTIYRTNHKKKYVTREYKKWKNGKLIIHEKLKLKYYATHDLTNIFMNLAQYKMQKTGKEYVKKVVGADRKNGSVLLSLPTAKEAYSMKKILGKTKKGEWYAKLIMQRQVYDSKRGELELKVGNDGMLEMAVLKDLVFFGDVRIIRE
ncbi:MAG: hypothetical protein L3J43_10895 [Sulfurovum sp.]|nr:hypothetical protein [Sulfurovum sp.]